MAPKKTFQPMRIPIACKRVFNNYNISIRFINSFAVLRQHKVTSSTSQAPRQSVRIRQADVDQCGKHTQDPHKGLGWIMLDPSKKHRQFSYVHRGVGLVLV